MMQILYYIERAYLKIKRIFTKPKPEKDKFIY